MKSYSVTDVGQKRQVNQDYIFSSEEPVGNLPNLFVVADGMGGHKAGDFASSYAVQILLHSILEDKNQNQIPSYPSLLLTIEKTFLSFMYIFLIHCSS